MPQRGLNRGPTHPLEPEPLDLFLACFQLLLQLLRGAVGPLDRFLLQVLVWSFLEQRRHQKMRSKIANRSVMVKTGLGLGLESHTKSMYLSFVYLVLAPQVWNLSGSFHMHKQNLFGSTTLFYLVVTTLVNNSLKQSHVLHMNGTQQILKQNMNSC